MNNECPLCGGKTQADSCDCGIQAGACLIVYAMAHKGDSLSFSDSYYSIFGSSLEEALHNFFNAIGYGFYHFRPAYRILLLPEERVAVISQAVANSCHIQPGKVTNSYLAGLDVTVCTELQWDDDAVVALTPSDWSQYE